MPEPVVDQKAVVIDPNNPNPIVPPTFSDDQQKFINNLFNERFKTITTKYEKTVADLKTEIEEVKQGKKATPKAGEPGHDPNNPNPEGDDADPVKKQYKGIVKGEQAKTAAAQADAAAQKAEVERLNKQLLANRKTQEMRDAAAKQDFCDFKAVMKLAEDSVQYDKEADKFYVVDESGERMHNASLQDMSLEEFFVKFAAQRPFLVNSSVKAGAGSHPSKALLGTRVVRVKADCKTVEEKADYINKNGLAAWEKLPLK